jgi:hypothetical protein
MSTDTFIDLCLKGQAFAQDVDDYVEKWHKGIYALTLMAFLGMTETEYNAWMLDGSILPYIIKAHRDGIDFQTILDADIEKIAARNSTGKQVRLLLEWLKTNG